MLPSRINVTSSSPLGERMPVGQVRGRFFFIKMEEKKNLALGKINFIMLAISMVIVVIGFVMMSGASSDTTQYNPEIFSAMRIKVAPVVCFVGFVSIIAGIMYRPKQK